MILSKLECAQALQLCLFATPWTGACWVPQSMGFSRQEYQSWFPCLPLEDLPDPGIKPASLISYIQLLYHQRHLGSSLKLNMGQLKSQIVNSLDPSFIQYIFLYFLRASLIDQSVKNLPAMWETPVRFLGQEDPLEKEVASHCSILAWKTPWREEPGRLQSMGSQESDRTSD